MGSGSSGSGGLGKLQRLDFIWLSNDRHCFKWFNELMLDCERELQLPFFKLHIYLTSLSTKPSMSACALQVAMASQASAEGSHPLTELRTVPTAGRPKWETLLQEIKAGSPAPNDMQIFFCGAPALAQSIEPIAVHQKIRFRQEVF